MRHMLIAAVGPHIKAGLLGALVVSMPEELGKFLQSEMTRWRGAGEETVRSGR